MTLYYDDYVEKYGIQDKNSEMYWGEGTYIMPNGTLFDVERYAKIAHAGGFVIPFFRNYMYLGKEEINFYTKEELLEFLISWEKALLTKKYDVNPKEQKMRLDLVRYLINVYKSSKFIWDYENEKIDFLQVIGIPNIEENWIGRDVLLKEVLVRACNYDAVESTLFRGITTSKFNIYETFYDYILHDYEIYQIPKLIFNEKKEVYEEYSQPEYLISDKELRLKAELEAICSSVPLEEREQYCRSKAKVSRYNFIH